PATRSPAATKVFSSPGPPLTRTRPALINSSAPRREATPARARYALSRTDEKIGAVPHYISLMRWTSQGRMGLPAWRDRVEDGEREIEDAGGKLVGVWVTLGRYDVVEVFEAPDDDTALEIVTKLSHHGAEQTETLRAFTRDEAENIIKNLLRRACSRHVRCLTPDSAIRDRSARGVSAWFRVSV